MTINFGTHDVQITTDGNDGYLVSSAPITSASGIINMMVINQGDYDNLSPPDDDTLYFII